MKRKSGKRVAVGMSGGVDSSVAAVLLKEQGYDVRGFFMEAWNEPGCRTDDDRRDAVRVAAEWGIPIEILDFRAQYRERVVEYFYTTYKKGLTPNPDVVCNREIKFGLFFEYATDAGFDLIATGHYARIVRGKGGEYFVQRAKDIEKDQSYFLCEVPRERLGKIMFPLGERLKREVREFARERKLHVQDKPDSMGVCFVGDVDVKELLKKKLGERRGPVVLGGKDVEVRNRELGESGPGLGTDHVVVGEHRGLWFHTIGQRGGFEIDKGKLRAAGLEPSHMEPLYVVGKNVKRNELVVGVREEAYRDEFEIRVRVNASVEVVRELIGNEEIFVRVRNLGELVPVREITGRGGRVRVKVKEKIFGVAEGQIGVLYAGGVRGEEIVVACGEIA